MKKLLTSLILCLLIPAAAWPDMYIWTDAKGVQHFSDTAPEQDIPYRQEKLLDAHAPPAHPDQNGGGTAQEPKTSPSSNMAKQNSKKTKPGTVRKLAKKQARLKELEGQLHAHEAGIKVKRQDLQYCLERLEKARNSSYQNYATHERRQKKWERRAETAQKRLARAEDKLDRLYDKISTLEADISRLK